MLIKTRRRLSFLTVMIFTFSTAATCQIKKSGGGEVKTAAGQQRFFYPDLFQEAGYRQAAIALKAKKAYHDLFEGPNRIYFQMGDTMAYISDLKNQDARTEGLTYGMVIAVQLHKKQAFDHICRWSKRYLQHQDGIATGYFAPGIARTAAAASPIIKQKGIHFVGRPWNAKLQQVKTVTLILITMVYDSSPASCT